MSYRTRRPEPHDPARVVWHRGYAIGSMGLALLVLLRGGREVDLESAMLWLLCASFLVSGALILLEKRSGRFLYFAAAVPGIIAASYCAFVWTMSSLFSPDTSEGPELLITSGICGVYLILGVILYSRRSASNPDATRR